MYRATIEVPATLFSPELAEANAEVLRKGDPDWKYVVNHAPAGKGLSSISIFDEDGEFVGKV